MRGVKIEQPFAKKNRFECGSSFLCAAGWVSDRSTEVDRSLNGNRATTKELPFILLQLSTTMKQLLKNFEHPQYMSGKYVLWNLHRITKTICFFPIFEL